VHKLAGQELLECYVQSLGQKLIDCILAFVCTAKKCWNHLQNYITESTKETIDRGVCSNPKESTDVLKLLIEQGAFKVFTSWYQIS